MARKNLLKSVTGQNTAQPEIEARAEYTRRGASRSMMVSIDEMAENAKRLTAGEAIVSLDTALVDSSFVSDRIDDDPEEFAVFVEAIRAQGQSTPILVRPHPTASGRYMIVFGHRRTRAAKALGVPVRAIVKQMEDIAHVVTQGQENTARANLSFIEKALYGRKLLAMGHDKTTIRSALSVDETVLSRMLSVAEIVPSSVIDALGPCRSVGRDRWEELKRAVADPKAAENAGRIIQTEEFQAVASADQFAFLLKQLVRPRRKAVKAKGLAGSWSAPDEAVKATFATSGKIFSLKLAAPQASEFGRYLSENLKGIYDAFQASKKMDGN